ncbi:MAG: response regulator [Chromatiales bacterium]|nr:response regulator [Gammaproteobacteria bacterium]MCP5352642.1 response regulator [Chromatiales bacterium]
MRIILIDDHALFRTGLQELLSRRDIDVVAAVADGREGINLAQELRPDVILLDLRMPNMNGVSVLQNLRNEGLTMPVVMLTTSNEERDLVECLRNGASGYLLKDMEPNELVAALTDIVNGKTIIAPELAGVLAKVVSGGETAPAEEEKPSQFSDLTARETEILCLLAEGQSNKVIARNLGISDGTVKLHVKAILRKLGVHSRVEAAVLAVGQGFCSNN